MIIGWDISTAIIGVAFLNDECEFLESRYCDLRKVDGLNEKGDVMTQFVSSIYYKFPSHAVHFVEDRLAGFSGGGSNAGTIMRLAAFNAMSCWTIHRAWKTDIKSSDDCSKLCMLHPSTVKAIMKHEGLIIPKGSDKKKLTLDFVKKREPKFPLELNRNDNPQPYCFDQADAYITAVAGYRKHLAGCGKK